MFLSKEQKTVIPMMGRDSGMFADESAVDAINAATDARESARQEAVKALVRRKKTAMQLVQGAALSVVALVSMRGDAPQTQPWSTRDNFWNQHVDPIVERISEEMSVLAARGIVYVHELQEGVPPGSLVGFANAYVSQTGEDNECLAVRLQAVSTEPVSFGVDIYRADGSRVIGSWYTADAGASYAGFAVCPREPGGRIDEAGVTVVLSADRQKLAQAP